MFPDNVVVTFRNTLDNAYDGKVTFIKSEKIRKPDGSTTFEDVEYIKDEPCRLSFREMNYVVPTLQMSNRVIDIIKIYMRPEPIVEPGSRCVVTQNGFTRTYKCAGSPLVYETHQEVILNTEDVRA